MLVKKLAHKIKDYKYYTAYKAHDNKNTQIFFIADFALSGSISAKKLYNILINSYERDYLKFYKTENEAIEALNNL